MDREDFSPMMSIVKKSVFESKFYSGKILKGYVYTTLDNGRGTVKEEATALRITGEEGNIEAIEYFTGGYAFFTVNGLSFSVLDWWVGNSTISASNVDYCC
jgi:hypothetical protein